MTQKFTDIVLDELELAQIEDLISKVEKAQYENSMPSHNKAILRDKLTKDFKEGIWSNRDVINGYDSGESQTVPDFNHYEGAE